MSITHHQVNIREPLTRYRLQKIINVREHDMLESDPPANLQALEEYAEGTASQLLQLQVVHLHGNQTHVGSRVTSVQLQITFLFCAARGSRAAEPGG